jgi:ppGpp synthetase/RelA/SpoT-type nucleotidyltranferase
MSLKKAINRYMKDITGIRYMTDFVTSGTGTNADFKSPMRN